MGFKNSEINQHPQLRYEKEWKDCVEREEFQYTRKWGDGWGHGNDYGWWWTRNHLMTSKWISLQGIATAFCKSV